MKKSKKGIIIVILLFIVIAVAVLVCFFLLNRGPAAIPVEEMTYETAIKTLAEARDVSLINVTSEQIEEGTSFDTMEVTSHVYLKRIGDDLNVHSHNDYANIQGEVYTNAGHYNGEVTDGWYKDGWHYLISEDKEKGLARNFSKEQIYNQTISGQVLLADSQIASETREPDGENYIITQIVDLEAIKGSNDSLFGSYSEVAEALESEIEFLEGVLTITLNSKGLPIEFSSHIVFNMIKGESVRKFTMNSLAKDISFAPVKIDFPPDEELEKIDKEYLPDAVASEGTGRPEGSEPPGEVMEVPKPELSEKGLLVASIMPEGSDIQPFSENEFSVDHGMEEEEIVAWLQENLTARGVTEATDKATEAMRAQEPDVFIFRGEKDGETFLIVVDYYIVIMFE